MSTACWKTLVLSILAIWHVYQNILHELLLSDFIMKKQENSLQMLSQNRIDNFDKQPPFF